MNERSHSRPGLRNLARTCVLASAFLLPGCATVTGLVTGAFTGFVDLPSELIHKGQLNPESGETWAVAIVMAPVGFALGPLFGLIKGVGLDISASRGTSSTSEQFGTYGRISIWRPYAFHWTGENN
ncbi:MAG TPA: hypothetical protein VF384_19105 [Planctomycetota bacterium]